jgi:hypothetical protein
VTLDVAGNVYVADSGNATIRKITPAGMVRTLAGLAERPGSAEGSESGARFNTPWSVAVDDTGRLFVADSENNAVFVGVPQLQLLSAASRKTHGAAGAFDVDLPLGGAPGVECRRNGAGGNHTLVFTFNNNVTSGSASVTNGTGTVAGAPIFSDKTMTVELSGVTDAQHIAVTVSGVTDTFSQVLPDKVVAMDLLLGDVSGNSLVNASDVVQVKSRIGQPVNTTNFRSDVNANGSINSGDIAIVKSHAGAGLP